MQTQFRSELVLLVLVLCCECAAEVRAPASGFVPVQLMQRIVAQCPALHAVCQDCNYVAARVLVACAAGQHSPAKAG